jgi:hypothetical protein
LYYIFRQVHKKEVKMSEQYRSADYDFFCDRYCKVRWEIYDGKAFTVITYGDHEIRRFRYDTQRTPLEQAAQFRINEKEPLPTAEVILIDNDDRFW